MIMNLSLAMKGRSSEQGGVVRDNENFLGSINLVTGDKINYYRHLLVRPR